MTEELKEREVDNNLEEQKKRRRKLILLIVLFLLLAACCATSIFYYFKPQPLPEMIIPGGENLAYEPHYLFSIYGIDDPNGIALSNDGELIYVTETAGNRNNYIFTRDGDLVGTFSPPFSNWVDRTPVHVAVDINGLVYVSDRMQYGIFIYDRDGNYVDTILSPDMLLSEYIQDQIDTSLPADANFYFNSMTGDLRYQLPGEDYLPLPSPGEPSWEPFGLWFNSENHFFVTDFSGDHHLNIFGFSTFFEPGVGLGIDPPYLEFGISGQNNGQLLYPQMAVADSQGRIYISDGNNGRISVWDQDGNFLYNFGQGTGDAAISLPRGIAIDQYDRLLVVDAVAHHVLAFDVSGEEPQYLYAFGDFGVDDGFFNYPNAIAVDHTGRLYIIDRVNDRIQVWSY